MSVARAVSAASGAAAKRAASRRRSASSAANGRGPIHPSLGPSGASPNTSSCTGPPASPASQRRPSPAEPSVAIAECAPATNPKASTTSLLSARHSQVRRAISGWGEASVSAPPASGAPSSMRRSPRVARKSSGVGVAAAASTSQARVAERGMDRSSAGRASIVISVSAGLDAFWRCARLTSFNQTVDLLASAASYSGQSTSALSI